jgi:hypothetical protein
MVNLPAICGDEAPKSVVRGFVAEATSEDRTVLADAIVKYAAGFASDKEPYERLFGELGCYYIPFRRRTSYKVWPEHNRGRIAMRLHAYVLRVHRDNS